MNRKTSRKEDPLLQPTWTDRLQTLQIHKSLSTTFIGRTIYLFARLESTNTTALKMAEQSATCPGGAPEGTLVLAETQSQGRGRLGRRWFSPHSLNLCASIILRPHIPVPDTPVVNCLAATSVVQAISALSGLKAAIKWPNDILIHDRKVAGILTELGIKKDQVDYLVIGIGINVNLDSEALPAEIRATATTLKTEAGQGINRNELTAALCNKLEERYMRFLREGPASVLEEFRNLTTTLGKRVKVILPGRIIEGWAEGVDWDGALILRTSSETREVIRSGDIIHLRTKLGRAPGLATNRGAGMA